MFKTEDGPVFSTTEAEEEIVSYLDQLAMKIIEGDVDLKKFRVGNGEPRMNSHGGVVMEGPKRMEVEYYE